MNAQQSPVRHLVVCPECKRLAYVPPEHVGHMVHCCGCDLEYRAIVLDDVGPPHADQYLCADDPPEEDFGSAPVVLASGVVTFLLLAVLIVLLWTLSSSGQTASAAPYGGYAAYGGSTYSAYARYGRRVYGGYARQGNRVIKSYGKYGNKVTGTADAIRAAEATRLRRRRTLQDQYWRAIDKGDLDRALRIWGTLESYGLNNSKYNK